MKQTMDSAISLIRSRSPSEEIDYGYIMDCLKNYAFPRNKLSQLVHTGALIRVKKGFYVFGPLYARHPYSLETLANIIYGPSYVTLERALQFYGMISERVEEVTSVTVKRSALFSTPVGRFSYAHRPLKAYPVGIIRREISDYQSYLIATPEKALVDLLVIRRGKISKISDLKQVLFEDFRIEEEDLQKLNLDLLRKINHASPHSTITHLINLL